MPDDLDENAHAWVAIDVAAKALTLSVRRARELAVTDGWRTNNDTRRIVHRGRPPRQYAWPDIVHTYRNRQEIRS